MAYPDETALERARIEAASRGAVATTNAEGGVAQARTTAQGHVDTQAAQGKTLRDMQTEKLAQEDMVRRETGLGDPGRSWGGQGALDLAALRKARAASANPELGVGAESGPVHVIRGLKSSYAGGAPGEEFGDFGRARQAINRYYGKGEYTSPEEAKYIAEVEKNPLNKMKAEAGYQALAKDALRQKMIGQFGIVDPNDPTKTILPPELEKLYSRHAADLRHPDDVNKIWGQISPMGETFKTVNLLKQPGTRETLKAQMVDYYSKLPADQKPISDADFKTYVDKIQPDENNVGWLMKYGGLSPQGAPQPTTPGKPATPATGTGGVPLPPGFKPAAAVTPAAPASNTNWQSAEGAAGEGWLGAMRPGASPATPAPAAAAPPAGAPTDAATYRQDYENMERLRTVMQKPIQDRGPEDIAFLHSLGPDYNIQANLAMHKLRSFFRISPDEHDARLASIRNMYRQGPSAGNEVFPAPGTRYRQVPPNNWQE